MEHKKNVVTVSCSRMCTFFFGVHCSERVRVRVHAHMFGHGHQGSERLAAVQCKHKAGPSARLDLLQQQQQRTHTNTSAHT